MSYGEVLNNSIYFTKAGDVLNGENNLYKLRLYYPNLLKLNINTLEDLNTNRNKLFQENISKLEKLQTIDNKINLLNMISNKFGSKLDILEYGINGISFTLLPTKKINISLESIFKTNNANIDIPLIKYNPGKSSENLYRLFTSEYISTDGYKIPSLYIEYNNDKNNSKIDIIANSISK